MILGLGIVNVIGCFLVFAHSRVDSGELLGYYAVNGFQTSFFKLNNRKNCFSPAVTIRTITIYLTIYYSLTGLLRILYKNYYYSLKIIYMYRNYIM